ncbi:MAG TPA: nitroreductase family protein [Spirochaetota bacterium]|nr:nitroreductase family protein [Spirochaetota bacterium]HOM87249.1 nitroreductase family protein [Spirochaetota bacterium]HOR92726.1 nitroreductase family protein [Spirochaetota bacterium]HOT18935.1 nitroreductase family protein [Spirochaetota bacterium]HPD03943.1 nitroreductase family protein [Spirochaetota bacterium]
MAIPTSRGNAITTAGIDEKSCTGCELCVTACPEKNIFIKDKKAAFQLNPYFGCIGCGHCMAICPKGAIAIHGRDIDASNVFPLSYTTNAATYAQLLSLMQKRRSTRLFKDTPVSKDSINKIIKAAQTAPMGIPPSEVNIIVWESKESVLTFTKDFCSLLEQMNWMVSDWFLFIMKIFLSKTNYLFFKDFVKPLVNIYVDNMKHGINYVTYDAPATIYFYGSPYCDYADPIIAATYAMLAAESLGLGTCMIGGIHPFLQNGSKAKAFREKYGITYKSKTGLFVIFGYPKIKFKKGIKRSFASVTTIP